MPVDDELLVGSDLENEVKEEIAKVEVETKITVDPTDEAPFPMPSDDSGYERVLQERFGHIEFRTGQLNAIKIILE